MGGHEPFRVALLSVFLVGFTAMTSHAEDLTGSLRVRFSATSTLHSFEGSAAPLALTARSDTSGRWSADLALPTATMTTGNEQRDAKMYEMFGASSFPFIHAAFRDLDPADLGIGASLPFELTVRDVTRPASATIRDWTLTADRLDLNAELTLSLRDLGLEAPRVLFIRVGDRVEVTVEVTLERGSTAAPSAATRNAGKRASGALR